MAIAPSISIPCMPPMFRLPNHSTSIRGTVVQVMPVDTADMMRGMCSYGTVRNGQFVAVLVIAGTTAAIAKMPCATANAAALMQSKVGLVTAPWSISKPVDSWGGGGEGWGGSDGGGGMAGEGWRGRDGGGRMGGRERWGGRTGGAGGEG